MFPSIYLTQGLEIPSYFLVISLVLSISLFWVVARAKKYQLPQRRTLDLSLLLMISSLVGARLFHVFYESPEYYKEFPERIFYLWQGGFVYYGGAIFAFIAALLYLRVPKIEPPGKYFDAFAPVLAFAYGTGRLGCFLAGCCYGKLCDYAWAVEGRHPTQLYASFWEWGVLLILIGVERQGYFKRTGNLFLLWVALHSTGRILMESFREDFRGSQILGFSVSTVISLILLLISISLMRRKKS